MCGIVGYCNRNPAHYPDITEMLDTLRLRGPDARSYLSINGGTIGSTRLAIEDPEHGGQPMSYEGLHIVFNGELYNYHVEKTKLQQEGYKFKGNSDTEYALLSFHRYGMQAFDKWMGQFAAAIWNERNQTMYIVRDRLGIKPLYYDLSNGLIFASEIKTFLTDQQPVISHRNYLTYGYIPEPDTIYPTIKAFPPGCYMSYRLGHHETRSYRNRTEKLTSLKAAVLSKIPSACSPDREKYGLLFSGGIDSTVIALMLKEYGEEFTCYTVRFREATGPSDYDYAFKIANHYGLELRTVDFDAYTIMQSKDKIIRYLDQPYFDTSVFPTNAVMERARDDGIRVLLTGDGGDELFGGYCSHDQLKDMPENPYKSCLSMLHWDHDNFNIDNFLWHGEPFREDAFTREYAEVRQNPTLHNALRFYRSHYLVNDILVKVDRMAALNSIETRHPWLDDRLLLESMDLPEPKAPFIEYLSSRLPEDLWRRPKQGFSIPQACLGHFLPELEEYINEQLMTLRRYHVGMCWRLLNDYKNIKNPRYGTMLWELLMYKWWAEAHCQ